MDFAVKWISVSNPREIKKFASILVLKELLHEAPVITFTKIFAIESALQMFNSIWNLIRDKKEYIRQEALMFFKEAIKQISQRELRNLSKESWLVKIYSLVRQTMKEKSEIVVHGNIMILHWLLRYSSRETFIHYLVEISEYVLNFRKSLNIKIKKSVIESLPVIAKYNPGIFVAEHLDMTLNFLMNSAQKKEWRKVSYKVLSNLLSLIHRSLLQKYAKLILKILL